MLDDPRQMSRQGFVDIGNRRRLITQDAGHQRCRRVPLKGTTPGGHLIENDSHGEQIGSLVHRLAVELLRRHVGRSTHQHPFACQSRPRRHLGQLAVLARRGRSQLCQAEIEDLDASVLGHHHVGGFQIAMDDAFVVRHREGVGHGNRDLEELRQR